MTDDLKIQADHVEAAPAEAEPAAIVIPELTPVVSSNVDGIAHDGTALFVKFKNGGTYRYPTAPKMTFDEMLKAESPSRFFRSEVSAKHKGEKLP